MRSHRIHQILSIFTFTSLLLILCACQSDGVAAHPEDGFTVAFINLNHGNSMALEVSLSDAKTVNSNSGQLGGFAQFVIQAPPSGESSNTRPAMQQGAVYTSLLFNDETVPILYGEDAPEEVTVSCKLDNAFIGNTTFPTSELWGKTIWCVLDEQSYLFYIYLSNGLIPTVVSWQPPENAVWFPSGSAKN